MFNSRINKYCYCLGLCLSGEKEGRPCRFELQGQAFVSIGDNGGFWLLAQKFN